MRAVLRARSERVLGDLNPLPFPTLVANCIGWVAYSYVTDVSPFGWRFIRPACCRLAVQSSRRKRLPAGLRRMPGVHAPSPSQRAAPRPACAHAGGAGAVAQHVRRVAGPLLHAQLLRPGRWVLCSARWRRAGPGSARQADAVLRAARERRCLAQLPLMRALCTRACRPRRRHQDAGPPAGHRAAVCRGADGGGRGGRAGRHGLRLPQAPVGLHLQRCAPPGLLGAGIQLRAQRCAGLQAGADGVLLEPRWRRARSTLRLSPARCLLPAPSLTVNPLPTRLPTRRPCTAILLIFYASPLSTIFEVVRTRNSASLQLPLSVMNAVNGGLWLVYGALGAGGCRDEAGHHKGAGAGGCASRQAKQSCCLPRPLAGIPIAPRTPPPSPPSRPPCPPTTAPPPGLAITDLFIAVPNGVGCVLGLAYCALIFLFPAPRPAKCAGCGQPAATAAWEAAAGLPAACWVAPRRRGLLDGGMCRAGQPRCCPPTHLPTHLT